jgi:hypothetical protein
MKKRSDKKKEHCNYRTQYYGGELAGDFENVMHQSNPRKDKQVNDVPVI